MTSLGSGIEPRPADRWVDTSEVITRRRGVGGIDMACLVRRLHSAERAAQVRRQTQYDPQPPV